MLIYGSNTKRSEAKRCNWSWRKPPARCTRGRRCRASGPASSYCSFQQEAVKGFHSCRNGPQTGTALHDSCQLEGFATCGGILRLAGPTSLALPSPPATMRSGPTTLLGHNLGLSIAHSGGNKGSSLRIALQRVGIARFVRKMGHHLNWLSAALRPALLPRCPKLPHPTGQSRLLGS